MSENTKIEWCDHTFNPVRGCTKVSPGCEHCYAAREAVRFPGIRGVWGNAGTRIVAVPDAWKEPRRWNFKAIKALRSRRVFCASLADVFEDWQGDLRFPAEPTPLGWVTARWDGKQLVRELEDAADRQGLARATMGDVRAELFRLIEDTPFLDWLLLTKRPQNVMRMVPESWRERFPGNVWMGTTVEDQARADERIPELLRIPARARFLSCEPLLGPVNLRSLWDSDGNSLDALTGDWGIEGRGHTGPREERINWVIAGGESGPKARPMHPDWARSLRDQCQAAEVPFFFKQWGEWLPGEGEGAPGFGYRSCADGAVMSYPEGYVGSRRENFGTHPDRFSGPIATIRVGKKAAGRFLDGREWNEFPTPGRPTPQR